MDTRELYETLKEIGTIDTADDLAYLFGYNGRSTVRSQWAKRISPDLAAWVRLWFALHSIAQDTGEVIKTTFNEDRGAYEAGLEELRKLQIRVWQHIAKIAG